MKFLKRECVRIGQPVIGANLEKHGIVPWNVHEVLEAVDVLAKMRI
jgi:hypothetical protein